MADINELARPPLVLIASGEEWSARSLESVLSPRGYAIVKAYNGQQMAARVRDERPDVLIIEDTLPDVPAITACQNLRENPDVGVETPILLTSPAKWINKDRLAALSAGAWDVFAMPSDAEELFLRLQNYSLAKLQAERAKQHSLTDLETGFYNLWGLVRRLAEISSSAKRFNRPMSCAILEVVAEPLTVHLTRVDTGRVLRHLAPTIKSNIRMPDIAGRISQSEVAIIAPDTDETGCRGLVDRLSSAVESMPTPDFSVSIRFGCYATSNFADAAIESADIMVRAASALQRAQHLQTGIEFFVPPISPVATP
jgi:PleD family two-component response regulator